MFLRGCYSLNQGRLDVTGKGKGMLPISLLEPLLSVVVQSGQLFEGPLSTKHFGVNFRPISYPVDNPGVIGST